MPRVAVLIAASPTPAFYSQLAVLSRAVQELPWSGWEPSMHVYFGGQFDPKTHAQWLPHLSNVDITWASDERFNRDGDWAQSDDVFRFAPSDVDVVVAMDADTLPVANLEGILDRVLETDSVAGVIAHYPTVLNHTFDEETSTFTIQAASSLFPNTSAREAWERIARGLVDVPLDFAFNHTLLDPGSRPEDRLTPFYLNFGVVFFSRVAFDKIACRYLEIRPALMERMRDSDFSGQAGLTLAVADAGATTWALPMRYNFPNDSLAEKMYPNELAQVVVFHYLRTRKFDRHKIFACPDEYARFLALPLTGVNLSFQQSVTKIVGPDYPFT